MSLPDERRGLCVSLHDVSPATWPQCRRILEALDERTQVPVTLLVIPWHHRNRKLRHEPAFLRAMDRRLDRGDEIALHGYTHRDEAPLGHNAYQYAMRRFYTAGEGEFSALDRREAQSRLTQGVEHLLEVGWIPQGFVAPAWMLSAGARAALSDFSFRYTTTLDSFFRLPGWCRQPVPTLVWSVRSDWRRAISRLWNAQLHRRAKALPLLRVSLHPCDVAHPDILDQAIGLIEHALAKRDAFTKSAWVSRC